MRTKKDEQENDTHLKFLLPGEVQQYLGVITDAGHMIVCRLLINGISIKDILALRPRDIKWQQDALKLKKPHRKVRIDPVTSKLLVSLIARNDLDVKSASRLIAYKERNIRNFVREYGMIAGLNKAVSTKTLHNTYVIFNLVHHPDMPIEEYHAHLGYSNIEYTQRIIREMKITFKERTGDDLIGPVSQGN